jgi:uncharacterized protein (DUF1499 family)
MGLLRLLTQNLADTEVATHADLKPLKLAGRRGEAFLLISYEIGRLPRWHVEATEGRNYKIRATKRRRFRRTADDVTLQIISDKGETWLHAASSGRGLLGDFGRNRRNILELFARLREVGIAEKEKKK